MGVAVALFILMLCSYEKLTYESALSRFHCIMRALISIITKLVSTI